MNELDRLNTATYMLIDRVTGEEIDIKIFIEKCSSDYWEKAYAKTLAEYIGITGSGYNKVLAFLLKEKNAENIIIGTVRGISEKLVISTATTTKLFGILRKKGFIKKVNNGCYMISPLLIRHGGQVRGAMMLRLWGKV
jgi:hypothetical protein